jgi:selenide,water dikinase
VDDPWTFGAIAATNSLSDVYAMGGEPMTAMNVLCWDPELPAEWLAAILRGGLDKVREAGAVLVGGHSVSDTEIKYGLSVTGFVHPDRIWKNEGARPGDRLVLTKPLGTGIVTTALKRDDCPPELAEQAIAAMLQLNRAARDAALPLRVHACTDITGFGLAGHAWEMARAGAVTIRFRASAIPRLAGVEALASRGHLTRGERSNREYVGEALAFVDVPPALQSVLVDPQTSGGLLLSVPPEDAQTLVHAGVGVEVGEVLAGPGAVVFAA